jgi:hypothetical protein
MKQKSNLTQAEQQQLAQTQQTEAREFATAEELLRADADQTQVPAEVATRLDESIQRESKVKGSWLRRLTSGT